VKRILLVSNDEVGPQMAGPGIRYYQFAEQLSKSFEVTLVVPTQPSQPLGDYEVLEAASWRGRRFRELASRHDVVVAQTLRSWTMKTLARADVRVMYDLYDPFLIGNLAFHAGEGLSPRERYVAFRAPTVLQQIALLTGDAFICASERQRDFWLGMLGALGRIEPSVSDVDPSLRDLIDVVPFGLEAEPPVATAPALKGVVPGIGPADKVLLWGGGVWNWFDPLTPIRAVHVLSKRRDDVKLFFLGVKHPNPGVHQMAMVSRAVELAKELDLYDRFVFFNFGWVPYAERANYLLDADIGVSSHPDTVESHFSFRTRLLDYFWAGLPTISTKGDVLSDLVQEEMLGRAVGFEDVQGWTAAVEELVDDPDELARLRRNVEKVRGHFAWPRVVEPLARLASLPGGDFKPGRNVGALAFGYLGLGLETTVRRRGLAGGAQDVYRILRRPPVP
jgi:glycosyltransferase involved in cell wall biosynthesis